MNADRRKALEAIKSTLDTLSSQVEDIQSQEQEAYDAMPSGLQESERGQASQASLDHLNDVMIALGDAAGYIDEAVV